MFFIDLIYDHRQYPLIGIKAGIRQESAACAGETPT